MLIVCLSCASEYIIDPAQIGADGRTVRCAACRHTFFVPGEPEVTEEELAETEEFNTYLATQAWPEQDPELSVEATSGRSPEAGAMLALAAAGAWTSSFGLSALGARFRAVPSGVAATALMVGLAVLLVAGRERIVRAAPAAARLYAAVKLPVNPSGLALQGVRSELVVNGTDRLLVVEGQILNLTRTELEVPRLELSVRGRTASHFTPGRTRPHARHWA